MQNLFLSILLTGFVLFFNSCNTNSTKQVVICDIYPIDFVDYVEIEGTVQAVNSVTLICPRRIEGEIIYLVENGTHVNEGDTVCIIENRELQNDYEQTLLRVENSEANLAKSIANLAMQYAILEAQVKSNETETAIQQLDSLQLNYISTTQRRIKELELKKTAIERVKLQKKLQSLKVINDAEIKKLKLAIQRDENRAAQTKERLDQMTLVTSQKGIAIRAQSWLTRNEVQEGDQVWSNMPILSIPDLSEMKVDLMLSEINYKRISTENDVSFTFDAMPNAEAFGKIKVKAPIGQPISENSKVKFFEVSASIDSAIILPEPGLSARCKVFIQSIPDTIVVPQIAIFEEDSVHVVYVKIENHFEKRQVKLGEKSQKYAVVTNGLSGNECISLIKPSSSEVTSTKMFKNEQLDTVDLDSIKNKIDSIAD